MGFDRDNDGPGVRFDPHGLGKDGGLRSGYGQEWRSWETGTLYEAITADEEYFEAAWKLANIGPDMLRAFVERRGLPVGMSNVNAIDWEHLATVIANQ